ncbi:MAG: hypothetical protein Q3M30_09520 [Candidatus Electrothrix sp. Rat3]|nr:hypothetical protein [Candidatus Electrothrix rattekaaiensis]
MYKKDNNTFSEWSSGSTPLRTDIIENNRNLIISVKCSFGDISNKYYALFDTAAEWAVIPQSIVDDNPDNFSSLDIPIDLSSRFGKNAGVLHICDVRILVDSGNDIVVEESTVLVIPDWPGPVVLGFQHLLNKLRWACDPTVDQGGRLYFGLAEE